MCVLYFFVSCCAWADWSVFGKDCLYFVYTDALRCQWHRTQSQAKSVCCLIWPKTVFEKAKLLCLLLSICLLVLERKFNHQVIKFILLSLASLFKQIGSFRLFLPNSSNLLLIVLFARLNQIKNWSLPLPSFLFILLWVDSIFLTFINLIMAVGCCVYWTLHLRVQSEKKVQKRLYSHE